MLSTRRNAGSKPVRAKTYKKQILKRSHPFGRGLFLWWHLLDGSRTVDLIDIVFRISSGSRVTYKWRLCPNGMGRKCWFSEFPKIYGFWIFSHQSTPYFKWRSPVRFANALQVLAQYDCRLDCKLFDRDMTTR